MTVRAVAGVVTAGRAVSQPAITLKAAAGLPVTAVLEALATSSDGLADGEASARREAAGRKKKSRTRPIAVAVLARQFASPFLILLVVTALLALALHDGPDAAIIIAIVVLSIGLSFANEYTSERAVADLRSRVARSATVLRGGARCRVPAAELTPGDVIVLAVGDVIPADVRLVTVHDLECDESALTGEALPERKSAAPMSDAGAPLGLTCCAYSGTVVRAGSATGVVVAVGPATVYGAIAHALDNAAPETAFQSGLRGFSMLLVRVTIALAVAIFLLNALLHHSWIESLLFALAIAIGLTPQLLPAIVTISLSVGARQLARRSVIVKRLVSIEDLGNVEVLFTDKTGTLTQGAVSLRAALDIHGKQSDDVAVLGLVCADCAMQDGRPTGGPALDVALWSTATPEQRDAAARYRVIDRAPFDYERQMMSVLVDTPDGHRLLIAKGAPEAILARCADHDAAFAAVVDAELESGGRTIALASRAAGTLTQVHADEERGLAPLGLLAFADPAKADAAPSLRRLAQLGVTVKIVTGDSDRTARAVCRELGLDVSGVLTGPQAAALSDEQLTKILAGTTIFARVTPEQKARIIRLQRATGCDVGFLGDGVNDAEALHMADVGISVDSATDVAKDAADIVLLEKDLGILADGVVEGRRIFANTTKYVLMGTSSNFGNMFSAAGASLFLPFLPMLPSQILLNNLLYDVSEMAIPSDNVDDDQLQRPAHWDMAFIRRFMILFGPISSVFDFVTFGVMLFIFHADAQLFRTGWFVESLSTQALVIFLIRTRHGIRNASRPSKQLVLATVASVCVAMLLPFSPLAAMLGFVALPPLFFAVLGAMILTYLGIIEAAKYFFYKTATPLVSRRRGTAAG
jgi:P-type Mg2+ transporter